MSENIIFRYSEFFEDDGGFKKVIADFDTLGLELVGKANKYKKDVNEAFNTMDLSALKTLEAQIESSNAQFKQLSSAKNEVIKVEKEYSAQLKATLQNEILLERAKQAKIQTDTKEIQGIKELDKAIQQENNTKKSAIALTEAERKAGESNARSMKVQKGAYAELSADLRALFTESANVASEMFVLEKAGLKASPQYQRLDKIFQNLKGRTIELDGALKKIDSNLGRNQRNVGNYASGYSGINNSINQITRELPAFTFSMQTGILALSNNIPILTDEIGRLVQVNKQLIKDGQPTKSVFSQILGGVLSLQTAMGVGILLLTLYGKEIGLFFQKLTKGTESLNDATKALLNFQEAQTKGTIQTKNELQVYQQYLKIAGDKTLDLEKQKIAIDYLRTSYAGYLSALSDEQIAKLKGSEIDKKIQTALGFGEQYKTNLQEIQLINDRIESYKAEIKARNEYFQAIKDQEKIRYDSSKSGQEVLGAERTIQALKKQEKLRKEGIKDEKTKESTTAQLTESLISLQYVYNESLKVSQDLKEKSLLLEYKDAKAKKDNLKDQINNVDFQSSDFQLRKMILDNTIKSNAEIFASDKYTLDQRLEAQKLMVTQMLSLAELERREALRLLSNKYQEEKNATLKDSEGKVVARKYTQNGLLELEKQYYLDRKAIQETFRQAEVDANKKAEKVMTLDTLNFQLQNLQYLQKNLSDKSETYVAYAKKISAIQTQINNIINQEKGLELTDKITVNENELTRIEKLRDRMFGKFDKTDNRRITLKEQKQILKDIEAFEKEKADIESDYEIQRKLARLHSIEQEKKSFVENSNEFKQLEIEAQGIKKQLQNDEIKRRLDAEKEANKSSLEQFKDFFDDFNKLMGLVLDRLIEITQKRIDQDKVLLENQKKTIDVQQERASQGLDNTLAYEQRALGKREADLIKHEKQEQRLQKIKTIYTSYAGYANQDPSTALTKALRDFALLEAITASFGDGGIVEDKLPSDGIFRGQSHKGNNRGIPILVEGREGIFSSREMENLGKENFYRMKDIASSGKVDSNFFTGQRQQFVHSIGRQTKSDPGLVNEMREVKKAIEGKPVQNWDVASVADGVMELVETVMTKNKVQRNHFTTKKRRL